MRTILVVIIVVCSILLITDLMKYPLPIWAGEEDESLGVLLYYGLYTQWYNIEKALTEIGKHNLKISNAISDGAEYFPTSFEELKQFDIIILSNVNADSLGNFGMQIISHFVKNGGGLLVLGGPFTLGQGNYQDTEMTSLLPVSIDNFDLKWAKQGLQLHKSEKGHTILDNVDLSTHPMVYWFHKAVPKQGTETVLYAGNEPVMVIGKYGKGKIVVFLGTPLGEPIEKQLPFWKWPGWKGLLQNVLVWLQKGDI